MRLDTLVFHPAALESLKGDVRELKEGPTRASMSRRFKERYGIDAEICDSPAGISGSGAGNAESRREQDRSLSDDRGNYGWPGARVGTSGLRGLPAWLP